MNQVKVAWVQQSIYKQTKAKSIQTMHYESNERGTDSINQIQTNESEIDSNKTL